MRRICILTLVLVVCFSLFVPVCAERLSDRDYNNTVFSEECPVLAGSSASYGTDHQEKEPFNFVKNLGICFVIGLVIALIVTGIMRGQLKSVRAQSGASDYVKPGSLNVTQRQDLFLYRQIRRIEKPRNNDGPGRSRGGRF